MRRAKKESAGSQYYSRVPRPVPPPCLAMCHLSPFPPLKTSVVFKLSLSSGTIQTHAMAIVHVQASMQPAFGPMIDAVCESG